MIKYPRTFHFPWSNTHSDDKLLDNCDHFLGKEIIATVKMDGECTTMYRNHIHARSLDSGHHESRSFVKALHGSICNDIQDNYRICGENLWAKHSIHYKHLHAYFQVFSIWMNNMALSWDDTIEWCELLGLSTVPVLYRGI